MNVITWARLLATYHAQNWQKVAVFLSAETAGEKGNNRNIEIILIS